MKRVVATGTFDILHPGHLFFLSESRKLGDELWVIVSRETNIRHKAAPVVSEEQRVKMIKSLKCVDHAILGDTEDMFKPIREINPDIITLGFNQYFDENKLKKQLKERGLCADVVRIGAYTGSKFTSSTQIIDEAIRRIIKQNSTEEEKTAKLISLVKQ
ncbi:MAG TPA: FAD synthase [Methanocorpusculum sp.]|nr:FAD synthase [Methanocorpusculum sp.]